MFTGQHKIFCRTVSQTPITAVINPISSKLFNEFINIKEEFREISTFPFAGINPIKL